jgi:hypothetical protein
MRILAAPAAADTELVIGRRPAVASIAGPVVIPAGRRTRPSSPRAPAGSAIVTQSRATPAASCA